jgi:hypothetical protein
VQEITEFHKIKRSTVYVKTKKFNEFMAAAGKLDESDLPRKAHRRGSHAKGNVLADKICNIEEVDSGRPMWSIATEPGIGASIVWQMMQEDLCCKSSPGRGDSLYRM